MGMKADWEFNAKCKLPHIPMHRGTTGNTRLPLWDGVCCEHVAAKACARAVARKRKAQRRNRSKVRREQNSPLLNLHQNTSFCFERILQFKVKTDLLWCSWSYWTVMCFLKTWVLFGFWLLFGWGPAQVRSDRSSAVCSKRVGGGELLGGRWLYWLFIINTALPREVHLLWFYLVIPPRDPELERE